MECAGNESVNDLKEETDAALEAEAALRADSEAHIELEEEAAAEAEEEAASKVDGEVVEAKEVKGIENTPAQQLSLLLDAMKLCLFRYADCEATSYLTRTQKKKDTRVLDLLVDVRNECSLDPTPQNLLDFERNLRKAEQLTARREEEGIPKGAKHNVQCSCAGCK